MKKLPPLRPGQERWKHKGKIYSIVDLTAWPEPTPQPQWSKFTELMREAYGYAPFEVALLTGCEVTVLDRFATLQEAKEAIEKGEI